MNIKAMKISIGVLGILSSIVLTSCTDIYDICDLPRNVTFQAGFYQKVNGVETAAVAPDFSLTLIGTPVIIYGNQHNTSHFGLQLNPLVDSLMYSMSLGANYIADTITLVYSSRSILVSPECGSVYVHTLIRSRTTYNSNDSM